MSKQPPAPDNYCAAEILSRIELQLAALITALGALDIDVTLYEHEPWCLVTTAKERKETWGPEARP